MNKKYVFIGGLHRSGTTLFSKCLSQHPEVSGFHDINVPEDEGQFIQTVYPTDNYYGGPGRFCFDRNAHLTETSALLTDENKKKLHQEWHEKWDDSKSVMLDKSPPTILQSRFLQEIFPNSYFIFITRHPVAASLATHKWSGTGIYSLIHHWVLAHSILKEDLAYINNSMLVSYESFVDKPDLILSKIEKFIGIKHHNYELNVHDNVNKKYFERWDNIFLQTTDRRKPVPLASAVHEHKNSWLNFNVRRSIRRYIKKEMFGDERQLSHTVYESQDALSMFEKYVNEFGYSLTDHSLIPV